MSFKLITFCCLLAIANAGYIPPVTYAAATAEKYVNPAVHAVATTHQNVVRSFAGTVSTHSKSVDTPYSSVRKVDTRINNNVYTPAVAKTLTYTAPAVSKTILTPTVYTHLKPAVVKPLTYTAPVVTKTLVAPKVYTHAVSAVNKPVYSQKSPVYYAQPAVAKTLAYAAPTATTLYKHEPTVTGFTHNAPGIYAAPTATTSYNYEPAVTSYTHNAPGVSAYGSSQTVHYSPAEMVSHMSFDGFGTHWGF